MKLWDKGFSIDEFIEKFTVGNDREIDLKIAAYDIQASLGARANVGRNRAFKSVKNLKGLKGVFETSYSHSLVKAFLLLMHSLKIYTLNLEYELTKALGRHG